MNGVKANSGIWMEYTRLRKPPICQTLHPCPICTRKLLVIEILARLIAREHLDDHHEEKSHE